MRDDSDSIYEQSRLGDYPPRYIVDKQAALDMHAVGSGFHAPRLGPVSIELACQTDSPMPIDRAERFFGSAWALANPSALQARGLQMLFRGPGLRRGDSPSDDS